MCPKATDDIFMRFGSLLNLKLSFAGNRSCRHLGHNGRWPNALNRAAILRLPAVQPEEVANGGFPIWRMPTPCPQRPDDIFMGYGRLLVLNLPLI